MMLVSAVAVFAGTLFYFYYLDKPLTGDATQYDKLGWNLAQGNGYSLSESGPYEPTMLRDPAYPFFLACVYTVFGHKIFIVYIIQILLFSLTSVLFYLIARGILDERSARYSSLFIACCPTLANYSTLLYSESFFIFLLALSIYFFIRTGSGKKDARYFVVSAVLLGFTVLCKTIMVFFFIFYLIFIYLNSGTGSLRGFLRSYSLRIVLFLLVFVVTVAPWVIRNKYVFGVSNFNYSGSTVLLARAQRSNYPYEKKKAEITYIFSEYLGSRLYPDTFHTPKDAVLGEPYLMKEEIERLQQEGFSPAETKRILEKEARDMIKSHPFRFIFNTPVEFLRLMGFMYIPALNYTDILDKAKESRSFAFTLASIKGAYRLTAYPLVFLAVFGICLSGKEWRRNFMAIAPILYINGMYCVLSGYPRYSVPLIPFYLMFAASGFLDSRKRRMA